MPPTGRGNADGQELIESISAVTGADVAASNDLTGATELGGDWELEETVGTIDTQSVDVRSWSGVLADTDGDSLDDSVDIDDDNDGILDSNELLSFLEDFGTGTTPVDVTTLDGNVISGFTFDGDGPGR